MRGWQKDKRWSDQFLAQMKAYIGMHLISEAPPLEDQQRNTDLIVLKLDAKRIGCRIRRMSHFNWKHEFTIRAGRPNGTETELAKIIRGYGDYFFYGFGSDVTHKLVRWAIADLCIFRLWFHEYLAKNKGKYPGSAQENYDGSSDFLAFEWLDLPANFLIASSFDPADPYRLSDREQKCLDAHVREGRLSA